MQRCINHLLCTNDKIQNETEKFYITTRHKTDNRFEKLKEQIQKWRINNSVLDYKFLGKVIIG